MSTAADNFWESYRKRAATLAQVAAFLRGAAAGATLSRLELVAAAVVLDNLATEALKDGIAALRSEPAPGAARFLDSVLNNKPGVVLDADDTESE